jgi:hypothetical protein
VDSGEFGSDAAQVMLNGLVEFGMVMGPPLVGLTWFMTRSACALDGKVRKQ